MKEGDWSANLRKRSQYADLEVELEPALLDTFTGRMKKGKLLEDHCIVELLARGYTDDDMKRPDGKAMGWDELRDLLPWDDEGYLTDGLQSGFDATHTQLEPDPEDEAVDEWQSVENELRHEASAYEQSIAAYFDSNSSYVDTEIGGGPPRTGAGERRSTRARNTRRTH